ncbi:MAG: hypothetical protein Q9227_005259 [Pyrenula ochraceoflavens]
MASLNSSATLQDDSGDRTEPSTIEIEPSSSDPLGTTQQQQPDTLPNENEIDDELMGGTTDVLPENSSAPQNASQAPDTSAGAAAGVATGPPPSRKDTSLREFLGRMDEFAPIPAQLTPEWKPSLAFALEAP